MPLTSSSGQGTVGSMREREGRYECAHCGASVDVPPQAQPRVIIQMSSEEPLVRVLTLNGKEVHRCEIEHQPYH
jgi:hypothetical protein